MFKSSLFSKVEALVPPSHPKTYVIDIPSKRNCKQTLNSKDGMTLALFSNSNHFNKSILAAWDFVMPNLLGLHCFHRLRALLCVLLGLHCVHRLHRMLRHFRECECHSNSSQAKGNANVTQDNRRAKLECACIICEFEC